MRRYADQPCEAFHRLLGIACTRGKVWHAKKQLRVAYSYTSTVREHHSALKPTCLEGLKMEIQKVGWQYSGAIHLFHLKFSLASLNLRHVLMQSVRRSPPLHSVIHCSR